VLEKKFNKNNIIVAYEPIWSIGTGKIPTASELKTTTIHIKKVLKDIFKKNSPQCFTEDLSIVAMLKCLKKLEK
jgi:triosephosphate isomerase